jgi:hypothetical protein
MNTVSIRLKSRDSRILGFQLDLKIVHESQLWVVASLLASLLQRKYMVTDGNRILQ